MPSVDDGRRMFTTCQMRDAQAEFLAPIPSQSDDLLLARYIWLLWEDDTLQMITSPDLAAYVVTRTAEIAAENVLIVAELTSRGIPIPPFPPP